MMWSCMVSVLVRDQAGVVYFERAFGQMLIRGKMNGKEKDLSPVCIIDTSQAPRQIKYKAVNCVEVGLELQHYR